MSAERPGDRPTIRGFFEEDTPVYSSRRDKLEHGVDYAKEYHPPAMPPASPDHETIRFKRIELSRTIDPRHAPTQKLVLRRGLRPKPGAAQVSESRVVWPVAFGVAALAVAMGLLWYRHTNTLSAPLAGSAVPLLPARGTEAQREVERLPPQAAVKSPEPLSPASALQGSSTNTVAMKANKARAQSAHPAHLPPAPVPAPVGSARSKVVPSSPPTEREPSAARDVWLQ